jgi:hypothetical protein
LIVVILASVALSQPVPRVFEAIGINFYHFWGVAVAMRLTGHTLDSPYALSLIPSLWFLNASAVARSGGMLAAVAVVMRSGLLGVLLWALRWPDALPSTVALSWLPLWCALLVGIRASDIADLREAASTAGKPTFPVAGGRQRKR